MFTGGLNSLVGGSTVNNGTGVIFNGGTVYIQSGANFIPTYFQSINPSSQTYFFINFISAYDLNLTAGTIYFNNQTTLTGAITSYLTIYFNGPITSTSSFTVLPSGQTYIGSNGTNSFNLVTVGGITSTAYFVANRNTTIVDFQLIGLYTYFGVNSQASGATYLTVTSSMTWSGNQTLAMVGSSTYGGVLYLAPTCVSNWYPTASTANMQYITIMNM